MGPIQTRGVRLANYRLREFGAEMLLPAAPYNFRRDLSFHDLPQDPFRPTVSLQLVARKREAQPNQSQVEKWVARFDPKRCRDAVVAFSGVGDLGMGQHPYSRERIYGIVIKVASLHVLSTGKRPGQVKKGNDPARQSVET